MGGHRIDEVDLAADPLDQAADLGDGMLKVPWMAPMMFTSGFFAASGPAAAGSFEFLVTRTPFAAFLPPNWL
jgi:hypothetical protein